MIEKAYRFGRDGGLAGVVAEPAGTTESRDKPAVLLLNSGLLHRVGPYRLHVSLARRLASIGYSVLRFDLSGIGDSAAHKDSRSDHERALGDVQDAMDFMSSARGARRFVMMGLCSGAENSHRVAVADSRVCGAVFLDGYAYPTLRHFLTYPRDDAV